MKSVEFKKNVIEIALLAIFISTLEREGINYSIGNYQTFIKIEILG
jgi:hypothetical protein